MDRLTVELRVPGSRDETILLVALADGELVIYDGARGITASVPLAHTSDLGTAIEAQAAFLVALAAIGAEVVSDSFVNDDSEGKE